MSEPTFVERFTIGAKKVLNTVDDAWRTTKATIDATGIGAGRQRNGIVQRPARLSAYDPAGNSEYDIFERGANIYLPHLPPELSFERTSTFQAINTPLTPDGIVHIYQHTAPMEIIYDFSLHYQDEYCENGALDLVRVASFLHALTLPFSAKSLPPTKVSKENIAAAEKNFVRDRQASALTMDGINKVIAAANAKRDAAIADIPNIELGWPTPCKLEIFRAGNKAVVMHGYVKAAKALFKEPWLQTSETGERSSYNLPSSASYSFTFVNAPTYRNLISSALGGSLKVGDKHTEEVKSRLSAGGFGDLNFGQGYNENVRDTFYDFASIAAKQNINPLGVKTLERGDL